MKNLPKLEQLTRQALCLAIPLFFAACSGSSTSTEPQGRPSDALTQIAADVSANNANNQNAGSNPDNAGGDSVAGNQNQNSGSSISLAGGGPENNQVTLSEKSPQPQIVQIPVHVTYSLDELHANYAKWLNASQPELELVKLRWKENLGEDVQPSKIAVIPQGFAKFVNFVKASDLAFNEQAPWSPAHILETTFNKCHAFFEKMAASYPMTFDDLNTLDQDLTKLLETNQSLRARLEIALQIYQIPLTSNLTGLDTDRFLNGATAMIAEEYENSSFAKNPDDPNFDDYQNLLEHIENSIRGLLIADTFSHETKGGRDFFAFVRYMDQISDDFCDATEMFFVKKVVNSSPNANTTKDDRDRKTDVLKPLNESGQLKPLKLFPQN